jgi:hypothetical protein
VYWVLERCQLHPLCSVPKLFVNFFEDAHRRPGEIVKRIVCRVGGWEQRTSRFCVKVREGSRVGPRTVNALEKGHTLLVVL